MNRKQFFQSSLILGGATILPSNSLFAASVNEGGLDKLVDENGNFIFGGEGVLITEIENENKVMLKCKGTDITNDSGRGQKFSGFLCGVFDAEGTLFLTEDTHAAVSASGVGTLTCTYLK